MGCFFYCQVDLYCFKMFYFYFLITCVCFFHQGDSAYPKTVDFETSFKLTEREESLEELRTHVMKTRGILHRTEVPIGSPSQRVFVHDYVPPYQHITPSISNKIKETTSSL